MFTASADLYDIIYSSFKDYRTETARLTELFRTHQPTCRSVLDIGCGTGEHARLLTAHGYDVDGLDLDPNLLRVAAAKNPAGRFYEADMCAFALGRRYDAILCLFSSIGYAKTLPGVTDAFVCFQKHLAPNGIVIVEPWFTPEAMQAGHTTSRTVESGGLRITRTSRTELDNRISRVTFDYEVLGPEGTRRAAELHELGLFTVEEMRGAFAAAGFAVSYDATGLTDRGLYIGRAAA
jgi:trans-aconitate methyltransferase